MKGETMTNESVWKSDDGKEFTDPLACATYELRTALLTGLHDSEILSRKAQQYVKVYEAWSTQDDRK
jgi:hypothetical protein